MGALEEFDKTIRNLQQQYEDKKAQNAQIQDKIRALEAAKAKLIAAKDKANEAKGKVRKEKVDSWWNGSLATAVEKHINDSVGRIDRIIGGIDNAIGQVNGHIWNLRLSYDHIVGLMSGLEDALSSTRQQRNKAAAEIDSGGGTQ